MHAGYTASWYAHSPCYLSSAFLTTQCSTSVLAPRACVTLTVKAEPKLPHVQKLLMSWVSFYRPLYLFTLSADQSDQHNATIAIPQRPRCGGRTTKGKPFAMRESCALLKLHFS